jgi:hypothetical protein
MPWIEIVSHENILQVCFDYIYPKVIYKSDFFEPTKLINKSKFQEETCIYFS